MLHDIGHLLYEDKDPIHEGKDGVHEDLGADYLAKYFSEEVTLPIRAHVASKRYLAAVEVGTMINCLKHQKSHLKYRGAFLQNKKQRNLSTNHK